MGEQATRKTKRLIMNKLTSGIVVILILTGSGVYGEESISQKLEAKYFGTLDNWVSRGGPVNEVQNTVVETCGKLVMLTSDANEKLPLATTQREEFHFRADVCTKMTVNRVHPQPEFQKTEIVKMICDVSRIALFKKMCRHSGLQ